MAMKSTSVMALAVGAVALTVAAAGTGAYLAVRHNDSAGRDTEGARPVAARHRMPDRAPAAGGVPGGGVPAFDGREDRAVVTTEAVVSSNAPVSTARETRGQVSESTTTGRDTTPESTAPARSATTESTAPARRRASAPPAAPADPARPERATSPGTLEAPTQPTPADRPELVEFTPPDPSDDEARGGPPLPKVDGWEPADDRTDGRRAPAARRPADASDARDAGETRRTERTWPRRNEPLPATPAVPPVVTTEALVIEADSVVGLQIDTFISTEHARLEDDVQARVTRDVMVDNIVAVPAGTVVMGSVVLAEQGGRLRGASRLGVRFHTVVFDDGIEVPIATETVYREGRSQGRESAATIGGAAVGGAILGAIFGGGRGAAIGSAAGAAGGTAAAAAGDAEPATLPAGDTLTIRLSRPATVTVQR